MAEITRDQLERYCDNLGLMSKAHHEDEHVLRIALETRLALLRLTARIHPEGRWVLLKAGGLTSVPDTRRGEVAQLVSHVNYGLIYGRFCIDATDGELAFEGSILTPTGLNEETFTEALIMTASALELHLPIIISFSASGATMAELLQEPGDDPTEELRRHLDAEEDNGEARSA